MSNTRLTIPTTLPAQVVISEHYRLDFEAIRDPFGDDDAPVVEIQCHLIIFDAVYSRDLDLLPGFGATAADAFLAMTVSRDAEGLTLPPDVALALRELAHQAVDAVCHRLSGGEIESAVFAEAPAVEPAPEPTTLRSEPVYRAGATPWTPRPCVAVDRLDTSKYTGQPNPGRKVRL